MADSKYPLVSIALCTYNGAEFLEEQLKSIFEQTYQNFELIIIDDFSSDITQIILSKYQSHPKCKIFYNTANCGVVKNFEKAISFCSGEYIALSDQDDIWSVRKIEIMLEALKDNMLVYHDSEIFRVKPGDMNVKISDKFNCVSGELNLSLAFKNCISGHAMLFRASLKQFLCPAPTGMPHDWWIAYAAASRGNIVFIPKIFVWYRQHERSQTDLFKLKGDQKDEKFLEILERKQQQYRLNLYSFITYPYNNPETKLILIEIYNQYLKREKNFFSFPLVFFLIKHLEIFAITDFTLAGRVVHAFSSGLNPHSKSVVNLYREKLRRAFL